MRKLYSLAVLLPLVFLFSCSKPLPWPESPLYSFESGKDNGSALDRQAAMEAIVGHYAHYDVVAYEDSTTRTPMRSFIISYGFTDFFVEDGKLMQKNRFVFAEQKLSRKNATSEFSGEGVQAIQPRIQEVNLKFEDGAWRIHRPPTPFLLGVEGDPSLPLSLKPGGEGLTDPDGDGHPGMTVSLAVGKFFKGEVYIVRREIFQYFMTLNANGTLTGHVLDQSEQAVVGASKKILMQESNSVQHPDPGLNPLLLVPIDPDIDSPEELMQIRDDIFPEEPSFFYNHD